ncbi:MAG TPA: cytochrome c oxidase subunit II [Candidatus Sulfotelmatobacter sp.]|nr:cytochrome c oxidase subunit II [Candidatus Sulfotelmatobacter sp.]
MNSARHLAAYLAVQAKVLDPGPHSVLHSAAPQAGHIEWLYWFTFWILFAVFVLMIVAFTRASAKARVVASHPLPVIEKDEAGDRRAGWAVGTAIGITVIALFVILVVSVITGKRVEGLTSKNPVTIQITGHQWWWEVTYPNSQADQTVTTANEIHVPVGTPVVVLTNSKDVIHSFWAPSITGKRDLLPGYSSAFWFEIDKAGIYHGQCAEFCGLQHAHMGFSITAESVNEFEAWQQQQLKPAAEPSSSDAIRGREVFLTHTCLMCHTIRGTDAGSHLGPDLTHVASRKMIAAETLPNTAGALAGWVVDPQRIKPGTQMSPNPLAPDDLQAVVAYLQSLH